MAEDPRGESRGWVFAVYARWRGMGCIRCKGGGLVLLTVVESSVSVVVLVICVLYCHTCCSPPLHHPSPRVPWCWYPQFLLAHRWYPRILRLGLVLLLIIPLLSSSESSVSTGPVVGYPQFLFPLYTAPALLLRVSRVHQS